MTKGNLPQTILKRRSPLGLRGLKLLRYQFRVPEAASQPTRAAWIEIEISEKSFTEQVESQPTRAAWIEIGRH